MGTRATIQVWDENIKTSDILATMYTQYDGYPDGLGQNIYEILAPRKLVNGYSDASTQVNGMGCAAALLIGKIKGDTAGTIYMIAAHQAGDQEYHYALYEKNDVICMQGTRCYDDTVFFDGPIKDFRADRAMKYLSIKDGDEDEDEDSVVAEFLSISNDEVDK